MLVTPQSGKELRSKIRTAFNDMSERMHDHKCNCREHAENYDD